MVYCWSQCQQMKKVSSCRPRKGSIRTKYAAIGNEASADATQAISIGDKAHLRLRCCRRVSADAALDVDYWCASLNWEGKRYHVGARANTKGKNAIAMAPIVRRNWNSMAIGTKSEAPAVDALAMGTNLVGRWISAVVLGRQGCAAESKQMVEVGFDGGAYGLKCYSYRFLNGC